MRFVTRPARDADGAALAALISECWKEYPGCDVPVEEDIPEIVALASAYAAKGGRLWVAADGPDPARIIGMIGVRPHQDDWEISKMYVAAEARGSGLAQNLLALAEHHAGEHGAGRAILWSDTRFHRAHRFYEKQGYIRAGAIRVLHDLADSLEYGYEKPLMNVAVKPLDAAAAASATIGLADILMACVADGASLGFRAPLAAAKAVAAFEALAREVAAKRTRLIAGWVEGRLAGCVALRWDGRETEPHVAMLSKLIVAPWARRRGLGQLLVAALEDAAREDGRRIIYLFASDHGAAPELYRRQGYRQSGVIPEGGGLPHGGIVDALVFSKVLYQGPGD